MRQFLIALVVCWAGAWLWSLLQLYVTPATGDGFTRGLNRVTSLFAWQLAATSLAIPIWIMGVPRAPTRARRWAARIPILLGLIPLITIALVLASAWYSHTQYLPETAAPAPTRPVAAPATPNN